MTDEPKPPSVPSILAAPSGSRPARVAVRSQMQRRRPDAHPRHKEAAPSHPTHLARHFIQGTPVDTTHNKT